jgi:hypothetical protein
MEGPPLHTKSHQEDAALPRKGRITRSDLKRKWPNHVALLAEKLRDSVRAYQFHA